MQLLVPAEQRRFGRGLARWFGDRAVVIGVVASIAVAAATLTHDRLFHGNAGEAKAVADEPAGTMPKLAFDPTTTVVLAEGKFQTAAIKLGVARVDQVAKEVAVAGRIEADPNLRVEIRPKAAGVVRTLPVQPGTKVHAGDVLVVLDSAEVASARLLIRERQRALSTARAEAAWKGAVDTNTEAMITRLRKGASAQDLTRDFADKLVGTSRGTLVSAWAELEMATHELEKQSGLNKQKIVGEHPVFLAEHTREGAQARFAAALEQVRFDVSQQDRIARQGVRNAEEMVIDAAERLQILGITESIPDLLAQSDSAASLPSDYSAISQYPILAPFDGTVVSTTAARSQRVDVADPLFVVADLSHVYAVANIPESAFAALPGLGGGAGKIRLTAEAYPGQEFAARLLYTAAEVDPGTRTVRIVAEAANPDGLLKLGLFTRIALDASLTESATVVPPGALVDFDGVAAVFQPDPRQPRTFTRHPVKLGRATPEGQIILAGLNPGDKVVTSGTFLLKSELILQNDTEEE